MLELAGFRDARRHLDGRVAAEHSLLHAALRIGSQSEHDRQTLHC